MAKNKIDLDLWGINEGSIQDNLCKATYGIGFYSDESNITEEEIKSKCNAIWRRMFSLCYSISDSYTKDKNGREYTLCKEWYDYNNFKKWYDENYYELENESVYFSPMCIKKNNTHFCSQLCVFVPQSILGLLYGYIKEEYENKCVCGVQRVKRKGENKYSYKSVMKIVAELNKGSDNYYIGTYDTAEEAFINYKIVKELYIKGVAYHYKDRIPEKLYNAMLNWEIEKDDNTVKYENSRTRKDIFRLQK